MFDPELLSKYIFEPVYLSPEDVECEGMSEEDIFHLYILLRSEDICHIIIVAVRLLFNTRFFLFYNGEKGMVIRISKHKIYHFCLGRHPYLCSVFSGIPSRQIIKGYVIKISQLN